MQGLLRALHTRTHRRSVSAVFDLTLSTLSSRRSSRCCNDPIFSPSTVTCAQAMAIAAARSAAGCTVDSKPRGKQGCWPCDCGCTRTARHLCLQVALRSRWACLHVATPFHDAQPLLQLQSAHAVLRSGSTRQARRTSDTGHRAPGAASGACPRAGVRSAGGGIAHALTCEI